MPDIATPQMVRHFWLDTLTEKQWYVADDAVDAAIRTQFAATWQAARGGACRDWLSCAQDGLAYLILVDQFPRNMFREDPRAFATDDLAVAATRLMLDQGWDHEVAGAAKQFVYMPLMHSETLADQDLAITLFEERMPGTSNTRHAFAHRWVIAAFGRFPYRNEVLGRETTPDEQIFLDNGGYRFALEQIPVD